MPNQLDIYTDSDWGNDEETRRSTTGGILMMGLHLILQWSRTQAVIALSSAEAELNASVKGASEGIQLKYAAQARGINVKVH